MEGNMFRHFCIVAFFLVSQLCQASELTIEQLIAGVNQARNRIKSGEMRVLVTIDTPAKKSPEEIQAWIQEQKEQLLKKYPGDAGGLIESLPFQANRYLDAYQEIEESNVAFQIFDQDSARYPETFQYKMTHLDRREMDLYSIEAEHLKGGYFRILTYDGQTQVNEVVSEFPVSSVAFFKGNKYVGFIHFELCGRSTNRVPPNATLIGRETIAGAECYLLEFRVKGASDADLLVKVWVDAQKQFCIRREEILVNGQTWEKVYDDFQKYGETWFPARIRWTERSKEKSYVSRRFWLKRLSLTLIFHPIFFR